MRAWIHRSRSRRLAFTFGAIAIVLGGCQKRAERGEAAVSLDKFPIVTLQDEDYANARNQFRTKILFQGPAPQGYDNTKLTLPDDARQIEYTSGELRLKGWVSALGFKETTKLPAVLFLHRGSSFATDDWDVTQEFRNAGYVVMTPMLRGENGLPGIYTMMYDEVNDVLAAAGVLAKLPGVDAKRLFVAGHFEGGILALLASLTSNQFRGAASFAGCPNMSAFAMRFPDRIPFEHRDPREYLLRSPQAYATSFKCPVRMFFGDVGWETFENYQNAIHKTEELAQGANLDVRSERISGNLVGAFNQTTCEVTMKLCIEFFRKCSS